MTNVVNVFHPSASVTLGIVALLAWRVCSRVRRMVGRQTLSRVRPWVTVTLFPLLIAMVLLGALVHPVNAAALLAGVCAGVALGVYGLKLTKFETTPQGLSYTPSAHLGIALSLLLAARIGYRLVQFYFAADAIDMGDGSHMEFVRSPMTLIIFGTLAGYYVSYAVGLIRWRMRVTSGADSVRRSPR